MKISVYIIMLLAAFVVSGCEKLKHELPEIIESTNPFTLAKVVKIDSGSYAETTPGIYDITIHYRIDYSRIPDPSDLQGAYYNINNSSFLNYAGPSGGSCSFTYNASVHPIEIKMLVKMNNGLRSGYSDPYIIP